MLWACGPGEIEEDVFITSRGAFGGVVVAPGEMRGWRDIFFLQVEEGLLWWPLEKLRAGEII